jgi:hypothetical protein
MPHALHERSDLLDRLRQPVQARQVVGGGLRVEQSPQGPAGVRH